MKGYNDRDNTDDEDGYIVSGLEIVRNYWNNFIGVWKRIHSLIREDLRESVT
jgi:hypothetical protein